MRIRRYFVLGVLLMATTPAIVCGQDTRKLGIAMGYPTSFGVLWHASPKVAIRPEVTFGGGSSDSSNPSFDINGNNWNIGTAVTALIYTKPPDRLRTYIAPRFDYSHASTTTDLSASTTAVTNSSTTTTGDAYGFSGSFGAQYAVGDRFTVFGEVGFRFNHSTTESSLSTKASGNTWGLRSAVGVVFYP